MTIMEQTNRRGNISLYGQALGHQKRLLIATLIALFFLLTVVVVYLHYSKTEGREWWLVICGVLVAVTSLVFLLWYQWRYVYQPNVALRGWVMRMCDGDFNVPLELDKAHPDFSTLRFHTTNLSRAFDQLTSDMEQLVDAQTMKLRQQNKSLDTLYHIASETTTEPAIETLLLRSAEQLIELFTDAHIDAVLLADRLGENDQKFDTNYRTIGDVQDSAQAAVIEQMMNLLANRDHPTKWSIEFHLLRDFLPQAAHRDLSDQRHIVVVPMAYRQTLIAMYLITTPEPYPIGQQETQRLLTGVSEQLSVSIVKTLLSKETLATRLLEDRAEIANELHDSLAQTLSSLRFSLRLLQESVEKGDTERVSNDIDRIKSAVDNANHELRTLIRNFRAPMDKTGILPALQALVQRFSEESGIQAYFHADTGDCELSSEEEIQILRIAGEALANIKKHSDAKVVRVMVRQEYPPQSATTKGGEITCVLLVEDDGKGFVVDQNPSNQKLPNKDSSGHDSQDEGEHIGLSIMHERALKIGARLCIESDEGEGTRVSLELKKPSI